MSFELPDMFRDYVAKAAKEVGPEVIEALDNLNKVLQEAVNFVGAVSDNVADLVGEDEPVNMVDPEVVTDQVKIEYVLNHADPGSVFASRSLLETLSPATLDVVFDSYKYKHG